MGLFDIFKRENKKADLNKILVGYFRTESSKLLGVEPNSREYNDRMLSSQSIIEKDFVPILNKKIQQDVANTLHSISPERYNEMFGEYIFLLFVRFSVISVHVQSGEVKAEEATPDILSNVIHDKIKKIIVQLG